ncbi:Gfo/Idh/MocA family protein [Kitasatospora azatica]|uniref:Gfo/Idh/MocA family protein n=1 Tax=Kitasatospora azatica TaxID=58347 RepID=UPI00055E6FA4|nr:Gfo/Idh/MocA family oxidoreductase [Kitasatospora azatica]
MRIGLLGTGPWAQRVHAPALATHPDLRFVGVWGRRPHAARALAALHRTAAFSAVDELFEQVDAVSIALPPEVQSPLAVRAAASGCHLLLDKPVATDVRQAAEVVSTAARHGVAGQVFFTLRFDRAVARWVEEQAATGGWSGGHASWLSSVFTDAANPYAASPWRREKGPLWDIGPHVLSVLLPTLGPIEAVTASAGAGDAVHLTFRHGGGARSTTDLSMTAPAEAAATTIELHGADGTSRMPFRGADPVAAFHRAIDALLADSRVDVGPVHVAAGTVRADGAASCDLEFGLTVVRILAAAQEALTSGRTVPVTTH